MSISGISCGDCSAVSSYLPSPRMAEGLAAAQHAVGQNADASNLSAQAIGESKSSEHLVDILA